jgi:hypothetical protein
VGTLSTGHTAWLRLVEVSRQPRGTFTEIPLTGHTVPRRCCHRGV